MLTFNVACFFLRICRVAEIRCQNSVVVVCGCVVERYCAKEYVCFFVVVLVVCIGCL